MANTWPEHYGTFTPIEWNTNDDIPYVLEFPIDLALMDTIDVSDSIDTIMGFIPLAATNLTASEATYYDKIVLSWTNNETGPYHVQIWRVVPD